MNGCRVVVFFHFHAVSAGKNVGQFIKCYNYLQTLLSLVNSSLPGAPFQGSSSCIMFKGKERSHI